MGIANDRCDDDSAYSLDSDLFTDAGNDEMDGTGLEGNFNPQNLRIEAGKRVGIDTDDESDGDGEHGLYHRDRDVGIRGMDSRGMRGAVGSVSSGSFSAGNSSDDDIDWNMRGNGKNQTWLKDDKDLDDEMPVGSARAGQVVDAGQPSTIIANAEPRASKQTKEDKEAETSAKNKSRALVQEALAKARATKNPTAKAFLERRAEVIAGSGQVLAPSVKAKGRSALLSGAERLKATAREIKLTTAEAKAREEETSRRLYSGIEQRKIAKSLAEAERKKSLTAGKSVGGGNIGGKTATAMAREMKAQKVEARKDGEQEAQADKLFLSKSFAKLREATRLRKIKKLAEATNKAEGKRILLRAVLRKWISVTEKNTLSRQLDARDRALLGTLQKGSVSDDEADAEERTQTLAGGKSVASDPRGSVLPPTSAVAKGETYVPIKAEEVASIEAEGGYVYNKVNIIRLSGKSVITINGTKLTSNAVNEGIVTELLAHYNAQTKTEQVKKILRALNLKKTMMDAGRGGGVAQTTVNLRRPTRKLKTSGGGGGGGGGV